MKLVTTKFNSGGLHEKHVVATRNLGNHLSNPSHIYIYIYIYLYLYLQTVFCVHYVTVSVTYLSTKLL